MHIVLSPHAPAMSHHCLVGALPLQCHVRQGQGVQGIALHVDAAQELSVLFTMCWTALQAVRAHGHHLAAQSVSAWDGSVL